jgi:hypothetical protein
MVQRRHLLAFLAGEHIPYDYTVLGGHGAGPEDAPKLVVEVVDQVAGDYGAETGWGPVLVELTPQTIPELVHADGGTLVCGGCGAGRPPLAEAFLAAGYDAYIGAVSHRSTLSRPSCSRSASSTSPWPKTGARRRGLQRRRSRRARRGAGPGVPVRDQVVPLLLPHLTPSWSQALRAGPRVPAKLTPGHCGPDGRL